MQVQLQVVIKVYLLSNKLSVKKILVVFFLRPKKFIVKQEIRETTLGDKVTIFDLHDGKMQYMLCQHSLFSRNNCLYLLCSCKHGAGITNNQHMCEILSHEEQISRWVRSKPRWEDKRWRLKPGEVYDYFKDMDWVDVLNIGVSHFGLHPDLLPRDSLCFNVFLLCCAITLLLISNL